ncbi:transmembrane protein, putative (macronuclear) [Tetrahymena thermophila SB210]|uniref:Transmembrane protein, putative n=1 Tax=Tetrahymena thermophila (strain SB210) TaxID=312017 RepID=W7XFJ1_TETTS|nr:transmembrane protein, putative [Tetrahymena thermophila SB210]EWS76612.1 transmembrane protein, putative [Tetrahymena thermophila SB210]|eukprot:XP_012650898.1 transmembrane protein, putative [Tetrahymena thermophila SB210]
MNYRILLKLLQFFFLTQLIKGRDLFCKNVSPNDGSCIQCNQNFTLNQSNGLCISDCDQNLYLENDSQQCVPSCKQNEFGYPDQGVCQQIYQCPILVDLGQDFHSGLASQIIIDDTNQIIISISNTDTNIKLWNSVNGILKTTFSGHTQPVLKIYLLQDSNELLSFSSNGEIFYWNYSTGVLNKQQIVNFGQLTNLSSVNMMYGLITLYGYQGEFYIYNMQNKTYKKYVGHTNIVLNSIIISPSSFITYSLDKSVILWSESTSTYNFLITCNHDSTPAGFTLLNFSSSSGYQSYLFSFGSSGSDSLELSISNLQSTSTQCKQYFQGDFTQPILNAIGDSSSQSVIVYSSAEVVIYGFNSNTNDFIQLQKISEQFFNQKLFLPLQGIYIYENSIVLYTQFGMFSISSFINNPSTIQSQQIIQTQNFTPIQINMRNIQGVIIDEQSNQIYIFGSSIQQINLKSQSVSYIITNLPIPFIRQTQSVPKTVYDYSQNIFASTSSDGLSLSYDFLTGQLLSIFQHPDYKLSIKQPQGITLCLVKGVLLCVAYNDQSIVCYHAINMIVYFKQIFYEKILRLYNDNINGFVLINSLNYLQIIDPFNSKIINTINNPGQFYYVILYSNLNCPTASENGYIIRYNYPELTIKIQTDSSSINKNQDKIVGLAFGASEEGYSIFYFQNGLAILYDEQLNVIQSSNDNVQINRCGIVQEGNIYLYYSCLNQDGTVISHGIVQPFYSKIQVIQFPITYSDVVPQYNKVIFTIDGGSYGGLLVFADTITQLAQSQFGSRSKINAFDIDQYNQRVFITNTIGDIMLSHFTPNTYYYIQRNEISILQKLLLIKSQQMLVSLSNIITIYDYFSQTVYKQNTRVHKQSIIDALIIEDIQLIISYNYDISNNLQAWNFKTDQSQSLIGHSKGINGVQFMQQQNIILSYDKAGQIIIWSYNPDLSKIKILQNLSQNQNNEITNLFLFTKYTNLFISLDIVGNVFMTNFLNGSIVKVFKVQNMNAMIIDELYDRIFLYGSSIEVYSAITGVKVQEIIGFDNQVQQVIFKNNYIIAYGTVNIQSISRDTLVVLFASQFKKNIYSLTVLINFVGMVGNNIDSSIEVWDYTSGVMLSEIKNQSYPQNLVSIFHDEQSQLFIVQNVDRYLFTVTPYFNSYVQQKDFLFAQMTSSYIKSYVFDFYSNILIVCNDDTIIAWQYYAYVGFQGQAVIIPSESLIMSTYHSRQDVVTYADLNQNIWQASQNQLYYKFQLQYQPKQIILHTDTHLVTDGINLYSYDSNFKLTSQLQIYPFSIYLDETIPFIFVQTYSYQIIQLLINTTNSGLTFVNIYSNHSSRIINCIINTIYSHIITFDVTGYLAINNYNTFKSVLVPQQNKQIIRDLQIDFEFKRLITCSQDQTSIVFSYDKDAPLSVLYLLQQKSSVVQALIDAPRQQILIWTDLQLAIQVRNLNSTNLDLIKYIYGPGDYQVQMKLSQQWNILAIFNQFQVNLHDRNANDAIINSLRMPSQIYNITDLQFISQSLLLIRSKAQLNLVSFSYSQIAIQKSFSMQFPTLLSLSYTDQLIINLKGINLFTVFNYTFPYSSDPTHTDYSQCYSNLQRTSSYFQLSQDLSTQSTSFQKVSQSINNIVLNIQMDDEQPFFFVQKSINLGGTSSTQQFYVYDKKQQSQKNRINLAISSFEQFNMPTLTIKNFNWKIENQTTYNFNKNTQNIIFVNSTFQDNIVGSQFIINSINSLMIDNMEIINLQLSQIGQNQQRALQFQQSQNSSLFQVTNSNTIFIKNLNLINLTIENSISLFQISQVQKIVIQNLTIQNVRYYSQNGQQNIWSTLFSIQNSQSIQINSVTIQNCTTNITLNNNISQGLKISQFIVFYMNANKNISSINLNAYNNQNLMIFDISQTYLMQGVGYIQVVNDTIRFQDVVVSYCTSVQGQALNRIQTSYFELNQSSFFNNTCLNSYGCAFDIYQTRFQFTKCVFMYLQSEYGGAISIKDSPQINIIQESSFQSNIASQGGSIYLYSSNLEIIKTIISQNNAQVGGAIRYLNLIPGFITKEQYLVNSLSQNKIENNQAKIFGQNIGSYPRNIQITNMNEGVAFKFISQTQSLIVYQIDNFMSGGNLNFNIKIYDEENGVVNLNQLEQSSQELQSEFQQYQLECISLNPKIMQINGNKASYNQTDISFTFQNIQLISNPQTSSEFYIQNNIIQIPNPQNTTQFLLAPLQVKLNVNFRQCLVGEIIIKSTQNTPSYCELCPIQKYSLITPDPNSQSEQTCKLCPDSCSYCQGNKLILKNGYWRENNNTDNIVSCVHNPDNCQGESTDSIQNCRQGYIGPLCETCDLNGKVWKQKYMNKQLYECIPCRDSSSQAYIYFSSLIVGCLYIIFGVKAARQMTLIKAQSYYLRMVGLASIGNSESTDKSDIYLKFYMHFIQISSIAYQIYQPQFLNIMSLGIGTPIDFLKFSADCRSIFTEEFLPHAYGRIIWSQIISVSYFLLLTTIYYFLYLAKYFKRFEKSLIVTGLIFIFLFLQPNIISGLVQIISCRDIGGIQYLTADVTLKCYTMEYYSYILILFLPLFLIWAIIIPFIGIIVLKKKVRILNYCSVRLSYGLLYSEYKKQTYYWEFVKINLKLIIIFISNFYSQQIQFKNTLCTMILFCYLMLSIFKAPYINVNFNRTDQYLCITLIICLQLNLLVNTSENDIQFQICSFLLYALHYLFSSFLIIQVLLGKVKRFLFIFGEKYPIFKSNFKHLYLRLGINSFNKMRTFKNWAKAINLIGTHLLKRNHLQMPDSATQVRNSSIFFSKLQKKHSVSQNQSPNTQLNSVKLPKRGASAFKLISQYDERKKDESEYTQTIFENEHTLTLNTNRLNTNHVKQEDSAQQIFTDRVKKKQIGRKELHQNYQFKTKKNSEIFNLDLQDM